jgi:hypothetical protein
MYGLLSRRTIDALPGKARSERTLTSVLPAASMRAGPKPRAFFMFPSRIAFFGRQVIALRIAGGYAER